MTRAWAESPAAAQQDIQTEHPPGARLRVVHVVLSLSPGGTERLVIDMATGLRRDVDASVCCLDEPGAWAGEVEAAGIGVTSLTRRPGFHPSLGRRLVEVADRYRADLLHCHQYSSFVYGALARLWRPRLGLIFTEHGRLSDAPASLKRRLVNPWLARIPNRLFAVSEDLRRELIGQGFPANRLGVIFNGIDPGVLTTDEDRRRARLLMGISDSTLVVGSVARLDPVKDLTTLIAGFAELHRRRADSVLLIVGDGPERGALAGAAAAQGLDRHVHFTGYRSDARALLPAMNIYASTSISEGISLTLLEAMAAGLPIVATRVGGTPEVVIDGETGLLVPARNVPALSSRLLTLAESADTRREMGSRARLRVERHFSLDRMLAEYHRTYRQLARC